MFAKPYKHKSNNSLKNSEKKHLAQRVQEEFGLASDERAKELVPVKGSCVCMKMVLYSGESVSVYVVDGLPVLIDTEAGLLPTVCALWRVPELVPTLDIHTPVLKKVQGGAPLYLPGVSLPAGGVGFPVFPRGTVIAARTEDNAASCIVGRSAISSADMLLRAQGPCMECLHWYGDQLCKDDKFNRLERPALGPARAAAHHDLHSLAQDMLQLAVEPSREEWPSLGKQEWPTLGPPRPAPAPAHQPNQPRLIPEPALETANQDDNAADDSIETESARTAEEPLPSAAEEALPSDVEGLLRWCLLTFLKLEGKHVELPLKTNLLYKNHLQAVCPAGRSLDVKKSSYKKLSKFLDAMQQEGLVEVREVERGVDAVMALNTAHPALRGHKVPESVKEQLQRARQPAAADEPEYVPPLVREMYCVTAHVQHLLAPARKGTALTAGQVRAAVTEYVRRNNLTATDRKGCVTLDATLANITGGTQMESVKWEALMSSVIGKMTAATEMVFADGEVRLSKARLEPVTMQVATRSGNKKVTLVSNLEQFGFRLAALAAACQAGAAATCGVTRSPGAKHDQLMLQGDQTYFVAKLLIEKYGLPKKFVEGADKALSKKK